MNDLGHLSANGADLGGCGVCSLLDLVWTLLGEGDREDAEEVVISGLDRDIGFNQRLPLADEGTELVRCEVKTVEVGQAVLSLNFIHTELDLSECVVLIALEIGQGNLEDSALQRVVCVLETSSPVHKSLSNTKVFVRDLSSWRTGR